MSARSPQTHELLDELRGLPPGPITIRHEFVDDGGAAVREAYRYLLRLPKPAEEPQEDPAAEAA